MARKRAGAAFDLFGEVPVTLSDVLAWMLAVPGIPPTSTRFGQYVRGYDVIGKIRQAKIAGTFDQVLDAPDRPAPYRLAAAIAAADSIGASYARGTRAIASLSSR